MPIGVELTAANIHDKCVAGATLDAVVHRSSRGPRRPDNRCLDKGYDDLDSNIVGDNPTRDSDLAEDEREANEAADDFCVPVSKLETFVARKAPNFTEKDLRAFAAKVKVHPSIVAGQLRRRARRFDTFRKIHATIRRPIGLSAVVDVGAIEAERG